MRHSASSIWKHTFQNDPDIPPCPEGMTLSIYAALLFSHYCQVRYITTQMQISLLTLYILPQYCLKPGRHLSVWVYGIRVCPKCSTYQSAEPPYFSSLHFSPYSFPSPYNSFKDVARLNHDFPNGPLKHHSQLLLTTRINSGSYNLLNYVCLIEFIQPTRYLQLTSRKVYISIPMA